MATQKIPLILLVSFFFCIASINAQQLLSQGQNASASSNVAGTKAIYVTDGNDYPSNPTEFCQTSRAAYGWIDIYLPSEFKITKLVLHDGNFSDKGDYNTNLYITAANTESEFLRYKSDTDPLSYIGSNNLKSQKLNAISGEMSETYITENIQGRIVRIWDQDQGGLRLAEIKVYGIIPGTQQGDAINRGPSVNTNASYSPVAGTSSNTYSTVPIPNTGEKIQQAITRKDNAALTSLLNEKPGDFTQQHIDDAFISGNIEQGKKIAAVTGLKPGSAAVNSMLASGKSAQVIDLMSNGVVEANTAMLNTALKTSQPALVTYLSKRVKPNSETFVLLANDNNSDLFEELTDNDNRVPDNQSINIAIDKGNTSIVNLGLNNGGNANEALNYAMAKNNTEMVKLIVTKKGVDPAKAFKYAVDKNDETLFSNLLAIPNSNAKVALDEAMKAKSSDLAILALETKRTTPTKYLKAAIETNNIPLAKKIVEVGGDANEGMETAIAKNNFELVEFLASNGASTTNPKYLQNATVLGSLEMIKFLVESGASPNNGMENAAVNGREDVIEYLLEKGADANMGMSLAAHAGSLPVIKLLVDKGANPTKGVESAVAQNKPDVLGYLVESGAELSSPKLVPMAVSKNYTEIFKILADKGAAITGTNLLQTAAANGNADITAILLNNKFNPEDGMMPAIQKNSGAVLQLLIEKGATIKDTYATNAVNNKAASVIPVLAAAGADFKKTDGLGNTFLHTAATNNDPTTLEELIKLGVPLDVQNVKGNTALHVAADMTDRVPIIMLLAKAGANLNIKNNNGNTPKDVAPGSSKTKKALKDLGAQ